MEDNQCRNYEINSKANSLSYEPFILETFWSVGIRDENNVKHTMKSSFKGLNKMGELLMDLREHNSY